jgi:hypothetical protein
MIMGTGAATNGVITVKPRKWLYVSMLHPETTEESVIKLISTAMKSTATDFICGSDSRVDYSQYSVLQCDCSSNLSFINFNMCSSY